MGLSPPDAAEGLIWIESDGTGTTGTSPGRGERKRLRDHSRSAHRRFHPERRVSADQEFWDEVECFGTREK
jgi:hypothetical protein